MVVLEAFLDPIPERKEKDVFDHGVRFIDGSISLM